MQHECERILAPITIRTKAKETGYFRRFNIILMYMATVVLWRSVPHPVTVQGYMLYMFACMCPCVILSLVSVDNSHCFASRMATCGSHCCQWPYHRETCWTSHHSRQDSTDLARASSQNPTTKVENSARIVQSPFDRQLLP